ncbi:Organic cation/carnitine transporter 4 [Acorus gramineus]|uniref:Organic cation/carnitine transporter 4 n=1 Tax=Acorus gramineus TaxID=55184 RepID=A0AAV9BUQ7_ACOGR|nr:Organic cation/carnitine transporter 4 [Acorus gramineus]
MGIDEMLERHAGEFGPWQLRHFVLTSLAWSLSAFHTMVVVFADREPRWYLVRRRPADAMRVMHAIAAGNGRSIPDGVSLALDGSSSSSSTEEEATATPAITLSVLDVLRAPITRARLCVTVLINFITSMVYYGLSLNVTNLNTNLHINVVLNAAAEVPAFALTTALLDQIGRKPLTIGTMWLAGAACLIGGSLGSMKTARMVCAVFGIFAMSGTFNLLGIYAAELFPTVVRNVALGCMSQSAQLGAILAPLVVVFGGAVPFAVFGVCGVLGGVIGFYLPETKNRTFFETMEGLEADEKVRLRQRLKTNLNSSS